ncbi:carbohydrate ABC transporter permease [Paenibacillus eucommiae]|uniref:ABC-type sugar transport system permease subunit n=1 Tax=Paenibacillus eucommiae TaxID=1355755 RepID=A0ABS4JAI8_9BACL|nr:sugar ABC transporter permease [Paenibacillus eucommiae]MBP1996843.1 ABC-type sugar transport system permease subunit [Paenibacillus eucommiae]
MRTNRRWKASTIRKWEGSLLMAPWVIGFLVFMAFPLGYSLFMSFHQVKILADGIQYKAVGWKYYKFILFENGELLYNQLIPFLRQAIMMLPVIIIFSLLVAIMLNQKFPGRTVFRSIFFLPVIFTTGQVVMEFMNQGEGELGFLQQFNVSSLVSQSLSSTWAGPIITIMSNFVLILWYSGVQILIFLAGRQTISPSVYEAARIDGASPWEVFWKITLPGLIPFILLNLIYTTVDLFTFPTNPILNQVNSSNYGQSSALAWIYFLLIFVFLGLLFFIFTRVLKASETRHS